MASTIGKSIKELNDAVEALERKVGADNSLDSNSIDFKIRELNSAAGHHTHNQTVPSATWTIVHNLGFKPGGIYCEDSAGSMLGPSVVHSDENTLILYFIGATDGFAVLS